MFLFFIISNILTSTPSLLDHFEALDFNENSAIKSIRKDYSDLNVETLQLIEAFVDKYGRDINASTKKKFIFTTILYYNSKDNVINIILTVLLDHDIKYTKRHLPAMIKFYERSTETYNELLGFLDTQSDLDKISKAVDKKLKKNLHKNYELFNKTILKFLQNKVDNVLEIKFKNSFVIENNFQAIITIFLLNKPDTEIFKSYLEMMLKINEYKLAVLNRFKQDKMNY